MLVSAVGALSVPKECETPGASNFQGPLFHSAKWDHSFDWKNKDVVVLGIIILHAIRDIVAKLPLRKWMICNTIRAYNERRPECCKRITQFSRQAHYLAERQNPYYSPAFKMIMRYLPFAMCLYRTSLYWEMERDFPGFAIEGGRTAREDLAKANEVYVKQMAPKKYWDALIAKTELGCKRKVPDTNYLACLHRPNFELIPNNAVEEITEDRVRT